MQDYFIGFALDQNSGEGSDKDAGKEKVILRLKQLNVNDTLFFTSPINGIFSDSMGVLDWNELIQAATQGERRFVYLEKEGNVPDPVPLDCNLKFSTKNVMLLCGVLVRFILSGEVEGITDKRIFTGSYQEIKNQLELSPKHKKNK